MQSFFLNRKSRRSSLNHPSTKRRGLAFEKFEDRHFMAGVTGVIAAELLGSPVALVAPEQVKSSEQATPIMTLNSTLASSGGDAVSARTTQAPIQKVEGQQVSGQQATTQAAAKFDLAVRINGGLVTPTQAKDLNLLHIFGGEKITVPVIVKNWGPAAAKGTVTVDLYLSIDVDADFTAIKFGSKTFNANLANNQDMTVNIDTTIPTASLKVGEEYYIVAKLTTSVPQDTLNDIYNTDRTFEFVGTPTNKAAFTAGADGKVLYFELIRGTLTGQLIPKVEYPAFQFNSPKDFISNFEGDRVHPYLDAKNRPAIGVGLRLKELSPQMEKLLASFVRTFYKNTYGQTPPGNDAAVVGMLRFQVSVEIKKPAISVQNEISLFNASYKEFSKIAETQLGKVPFARLNPLARIAVVDMVYDTGSIPAAVKPGLVEQDYVQAGFDLLNAKLKVSSPESVRRVGSEYQYLTVTARGHLGKFVS